MPFEPLFNSLLFKNRRTELIKNIQQAHPEKSQNGIIILFAGFEHEGTSFKQESSFFYLTGIQEPAAALAIDIESQKTTLYIPHFGNERDKWIANALNTHEKTAHAYGIENIQYSGDPSKGYQAYALFERAHYRFLLDEIAQWIQQKRSLFTLAPDNAASYIEQRYTLQHIQTFIPTLKEHLIDISPLVARMRRKKTNPEIELLYKAINITLEAHEMAARITRPGKIEYEVQAALEYVFISSGGSPAFPSIIASGKNSTILHYQHNNKVIEKNDVVVVDIGARYSYYCGDITRTYPASGTFTKRQRELYDIVLQTQQYIADIAKPGMWLSHADHPEKSLNHLARAFLKENKYDQYFPHGIGHFLGIDVHDVGDYTQPLEVGDVITIEPGIYIPEEQLGIRIEDNYWIVPEGCICLSEELPKAAEDIELFMQEPIEIQEDHEPGEDSSLFE